MAKPAPHPLIAKIALDLLGDVDALTDELVARIIGQIEIYRGEPVVGPTDLRRSVRHNLEYMFRRLSDRPALDLSAPQVTGQERAEQGAPLPEVLRAFRIGFAFLWEKLLAAARTSGQRSLDELLETATEIWALADDYSLAVTEAFRATRGRAMIEADRHRSMLLASLLDGPSGDQSAWELAKLLGLPYTGSFLVVVAETVELGRPAFPGLEGRLATLDVASAWRVQPGEEIGLLSYGRRRTADDVREAVAGCATGRVGLSPEFTRLDQTPCALRFARVALETVAADAVDVRQLADSALGELVMGNLDATRAFVQRVLGAVLALPDDDRDTLITTAGAWVDSGGSAAEAARILFCHQNTVRYRMRRLEEHLHGTIDSPSTIAELATALQALRLFPGLGAPARG